MKRNSMAQALGQAAGHSFSQPQVSEMSSAEAPREQSGDGPGLLSAVQGRKKPITCFFDPEVSRQIRKVALDQDKTMQKLLQEALNDLFRKYNLPPIA